MLLFGKQRGAGLIYRKFNRCGSLCRLIIIGFTSALFLFGGLARLKTKPISRKPCNLPKTQLHVYGTDPKSHCYPIKATSELVDTSDGDVGGKFMEKMKTPRKLATYLIEPQDVTSLPDNCIKFKDQVKWNLVFFVKSAISNFKRRAAIRKTWGSLKFFRSAMIKVIFLVGTEVDSGLQKTLEREVEMHHDILQLQLMDFSRTVPEKVLAGMQWSSERLPAEWIYASIDDDMAVYLPNLVNYLNELFQPEFSNITITKPCYKDLPIVCINKLKIRDVPERRSSSKWYVSRDEFPGDAWPTYCRGGLYLMSNKFASDIFEKSRTTTYLSMDDVWITGFMRRQLGVGDCNIMGSPYSDQSDIWLLNLFFDDGGDKAFMKHLWGNIVGWSVDIKQLLHQEWHSWMKRTNFHEGCFSST